MNITISMFQSHGTGMLYKRVVNDNRLAFKILIDFFNQPAVQLRMRDAETHHDRPALAGAIKELENLPDLHNFFWSYDVHETQLTRQAIGVLVLMHMEAMGWEKRGNKKGFLGRRFSSNNSAKKGSGSYYNQSGMSHWFTRAQRYRPKRDSPQWDLWNALLKKASDKTNENGES